MATSASCKGKRCRHRVRPIRRELTRKCLTKKRTSQINRPRRTPDLHQHIKKSGRKRQYIHRSFRPTVKQLDTPTPQPTTPNRPLAQTWKQRIAQLIGKGRKINTVPNHMEKYTLANASQPSVRRRGMTIHQNGQMNLGTDQSGHGLGKSTQSQPAVHSRLDCKPGHTITVKSQLSTANKTHHKRSTCDILARVGVGHYQDCTTRGEKRATYVCMAQQLPYAAVQPRTVCRRQHHPAKRPLPPLPEM